MTKEQNFVACGMTFTYLSRMKHVESDVNVYGKIPSKLSTSTLHFWLSSWFTESISRLYLCLTLCEICVAKVKKNGLVKAGGLVK